MRTTLNALLALAGTAALAVSAAALTPAAADARTGCSSGHRCTTTLALTAPATTMRTVPAAVTGALRGPNGPLAAQPVTLYRRASGTSRYTAVTVKTSRNGTISARVPVTGTEYLYLRYAGTAAYKPAVTTVRTVTVPAYVAPTLAAKTYACAYSTNASSTPDIPLRDYRVTETFTFAGGVFGTVNLTDTRLTATAHLVGQPVRQSTMFVYDGIYVDPSTGLSDLDGVTLTPPPQDKVTVVSPNWDGRAYKAGYPGVHQLTLPGSTIHDSACTAA